MTIISTFVKMSSMPVWKNLKLSSNAISLSQELILQNSKHSLKKNSSELKSQIADVRSELKAEIADLRSDVRVQTSRIDSLVHWNYWIIALFITFFMMPSVIEGIRAVFSALTNGIASFFKRKNSD